jgi:hypothetical protein
VLGWWDLLPHLDDPEARAAAFATLRAQGRALASSTALGCLVAQPFLAGTDIEPGSVVAALPRRSTQHGKVWLVIGDVRGRQVLLDQPGLGARLLDADAVDLRPVVVPGRLEVHELVCDPAAGQTLQAEEVAATLRARSTYAGRVAAAEELVGAAEVAVQLAVDYSSDREQFGQPIGKFQAVRHLLSWAKTDVVAVDSLIRKALLLFDDPPLNFDQVVKALAGRNGRRACERALQVLGGIGFTAEHEHHHHHSRVLLLDSVLGSSADLSHDLGAWVRSGTDPEFAASVIGRS